MTLAATIDLAEAASRRWPLIVVGAGPAGSLAAREAARRGVSVLLVDRARFPRRKVCGCCLNLRALDTLQSVGLGDLVTRCGGRELNGLRLATVGAEARMPLPGGAVLSREAFDAELIREAVNAGVAFLPETLAIHKDCTSDARHLVLRNGGHSVDGTAEVVLAADGLGSSLMGAEVRSDARLGVGAVAASGPDCYTPCLIHMVCGTGGYVGLVRLEDDRIDLAAALDPTFVRKCGGMGRAIATLLTAANWPLPDELETLSWKGTPLLSRRPRRVAVERMLAIGDAAGYVEPFTGEGMAWALAGAVAVAPLLARGWSPSLMEEWPRVHSRTVRRRQGTAWIAAMTLRYPQLVRLLVGALSVLPGLAAPVVGRLNATNSSR